ncbi:MAG: tetratricopeptide repeat protein [Planctomycetota bacterium]
MIDPCKKALSDAIALHQAGQLAAAEIKYRGVLELQPDQPDALHLLGVMAHQRGDTDTALDLIQRSLAANDDQPRAHNNLGNVYSERSRYAEAVPCYQRATELAPDYARAHANLGKVLQALERSEEACAALTRALALAPEDDGSWATLGAAHAAVGNLLAAVNAYREAARLARDPVPAYRQLSSLLRKTGQLGEARAVYDQWLECAPDDPVALHLRAACEPGGGPERASDDYVRATFDGFANEFDQRLEELHYRAPEEVVAALREHRGELPERELDLLDAGCGTGLCGAHGLGAGARRLVGVDLSGPMLECARSRGGYDELVEAELTHYLSGLDSEFDGIVSADTLVYFGDLRPVLTAAAAALRRPGLLIFTVERSHDETPAGRHVLNRFGRYEHSEPYLRETLAEAGFVPLQLETVLLRTEGGLPVIGFLVVAKRGPTPA